jgi:hypothetical protein
METSNNKPDSYQEHKRICINCKYVLVTGDYDSCAEYFCNFNAPPRPFCGSVSMGESFGGVLTSDEEFERKMKAWNDWSKPRKVEPFGYCDEFEEKS